jgi:hypothetical protein
MFDTAHKGVKGAQRRRTKRSDRLEEAIPAEVEHPHPPDIHGRKPLFFFNVYPAAN